MSTPAPTARHEIRIQLVHELGIAGFNQVHALRQVFQVGSAYIFLVAVPSSTPGLKSASRNTRRL
jgi:hypothetical protein